MYSSKKIKLSEILVENDFQLQSSGKILLKIENELSRKLNLLEFSNPVQYVYNPLHYASELHHNFIEKYMISSTQKVMFLGLNPGPWGMVQNGIPFGEWRAVQQWFSVSGDVGNPPNEHPSRRVLGLQCKRSEISGKRFWALFQKLCGTPEQFFKHCFVYNICPLAFLSSTGKNITPAELKIEERKQLLKLCEEALCEIINQLKVEIVVCIGKFVAKHATALLGNCSHPEIKILSIPHPSPRNPNSKNWEENTEKLLESLNLTKYLVPDGAY